MEYIGSELELFSHAVNWKNYFARAITPYIKGDVLEVGAGLGVNSQFLQNPHVDSWHYLEPDERLCSQIEQHMPPALPRHAITCGTIDALEGLTFDTVLYIDVLEHIAQSKEELEKLQRFVKPGGHLIILIPAYNFLFSEFDKSIGHYRRYNKRLLKSEVPGGFAQVKLFYLDSLGVIASIANKLLLHQQNPTAKQVAFWDKVIVPLSKLTDKVFFHAFGKSLIGIYKRK
ncbi:class I SAM-dependent methyltransferase [Pontibacter liquoris]|uniref:class I SAM-dependent methyltransferase n=1 Tax=Pontibacter liquoris TaxID=2905677 RepID=UPI001FA7C957|nr:class I SAM-dependent methyltransferase [Pontibacter liquoris]